jgi:hypothetical protein
MVATTVTKACGSVSALVTGWKRVVRWVVDQFKSPCVYTIDIVCTIVAL